MKTLCLNTSGSLAEISLINGDKVCTEYVTGPHCEKLMPKVDKMLVENDLSINDIDTFSVVIGPGSFTGIRIAVASVKGVLVVKREAKIVSVNSFDLIAHNVSENKFLVVLESGNEDKYVALYQDNKCKKIWCMTTSRIVEYIQKENISAFADINEKEKLNTEFNYLEIKKDTLVEITKKKISENDFVNINDLAPVYVKLSQAERARSEKILSEMQIVKVDSYNELAEIEEKCFTFDKWSEQIFQEELSLPNKYYYVAKWQNKNIGYIGFETNIDDMNLQKIAVLEDYRNCGVASALFNFSLEQKKLLGKNRYFLEVDEHNDNAIKLYEKLGFSAIMKRENYYKNGDACLFMQYHENKNK